MHPQTNWDLQPAQTHLKVGEFMPSRKELANAIRVLSMDAVQKANSGHP